MGREAWQGQAGRQEREAPGEEATSRQAREEERRGLQASPSRYALTDSAAFRRASGLAAGTRLAYRIEVGSWSTDLPTRDRAPVPH